MPAWRQRTKGTDALDRPRARLTPRGTVEDRTGRDTGRYPLAAFDDLATAWAEAAAAAEVQAAGRPWEREVKKGKTWLVHWQARPADIARIETAPPQGLLVFGSQVGPVLPARRWRDLQAVLDEHAPGRRVEDVPVVPSPRGRRHPPKMTAWDEVRAIILQNRGRAWDSFTTAELQRFTALLKKWWPPRRCARPDCFEFLPRTDRRAYCSPACKQAAKKERRRPAAE